MDHLDESTGDGGFWASLMLLITNPSQWSARWYRRKNTYDSVAVRSDLERPPEDAVPRRFEETKQGIARALSETGLGDESAQEDEG